MFDLPAELALAILAYLPFESLASLKLVCRAWRTFFEVHDSAIYHKAAFFHGLIPSLATALGDVRGLYSRRALVGVTGWKDLCRRRRLIDQSWSGKASSGIAQYHSSGTSVHRIKVDEKAGYVLTTSSEGGLRVIDMERDKVLWSLPQNHVRGYAHCEYAEGFVVFDCVDGAKEVWRRVDDYDEDEASRVVDESCPRARQMTAWMVANAAQAAEAGDANGSTRGRFRPWALLRPPEPTRAFRFSYPLLGAAAWDNVYLWDVRTGKLVQTIEGTQSDDGQAHVAGAWPAHRFLGNINYIEIGPRHVFVCGIHCLRAFSRETGRCVLDLPSSRPAFGAWRFAISSDRPDDVNAESALVRHALVVNAELERTEHTVVDEFIAVHVSSCGRHLACLLLSSKLVFIRDFERARQEDVSVFDLSVEIQLGSPCYSSRYLAFENGRIGVATRTGVFIVEPDWTQSTPTRDEPPRLSISRVPIFGNRSCLAGITCLQMTDTGLFVNWDSSNYGSGDYVDYDELFYEALEEEAKYASLSNGVLVALVDLNEGNGDDSSTVFSVDFVPA